MTRIQPNQTIHPPEARTVLVTGAAVRIGQSIALRFAHSGWRVAIHYGRSVLQAEQTLAQVIALGVDAFLLQADLADEAAVKTLVPSVKARWGRIDAVINNASKFENDDSASFTYAQLQAHMGPNLAAPIVLARALYDALGPNERGVVINLLDQKLFNLNPDFVSYTMTKAALSAATTMLATALAPKVRVVGVAPGLTLPSYLQDQKAFEKAHQSSVLGHSSELADVVETIYFAATNGSITGSTLLVDGGQHLLHLPRDVSFMP
jgi:NAD(P)-dependent dehydrogenase (short-subunit alcohol dehydrogenase family)